MSSKLIIIGSKNPVKINASKILNNYGNFRYEGINAKSGVADQPKGEEETRLGAWNRAWYVAQIPHTAFGVGIESGIREVENRLYTFTYCTIIEAETINGTKSPKKIGIGRSIEFELPSKVAKLVYEGKELGDAMDEYTGLKNTKKGIGASGILSKGLLSRTAIYEPAVIAAFLPFINDY